MWQSNNCNSNLNIKETSTSFERLRNLDYNYCCYNHNHDQLFIQGDKLRLCDT